MVNCIECGLTGLQIIVFVCVLVLIFIIGWIFGHSSKCNESER